MRLKYKKQKGFIQHHFHLTFFNMFLNIRTKDKYKTKFPLSSESGAGFTLIELIVVMAVFLFVIGATLGIFISIFQNQKKVLAEQQILNQISYIEEYMSKALRMAKTQESTDGACLPLVGDIYSLTYNTGLKLYTGIKFINQSDDNSCWKFYLDVASPTDPTLVLWEERGLNLPVALTTTNLQFDPINPIRFSINGLDCGGVIPCGASNIDTSQPRVTILLNVINNSVSGSSCETACPTKLVCGNDKKCHPIITIQTTVSRRNLNVK